MEYNKSFIHPILTKGWSELQNYHDFPDNVEVLFSYYGHNLYFIEKFKEINDKTLIPPFHSQSKMPLHTIHFETHLTDYDFINTFMVNIKMSTLFSFLIILNYSTFTLIVLLNLHHVEDDFAIFIKQNGIQQLRLCGDNGKYQTFEVYFLNDHNLTTQLGINWDKFCKSNHFKNYQKICFKFDTSNLTKCYVYPPMNPTSVPNSLV